MVTRNPKELRWWCDRAWWWFDRPASKEELEELRFWGPDGQPSRSWPRAAVGTRSMRGDPLSVYGNATVWFSRDCEGLHATLKPEDSAAFAKDLFERLSQDEVLKKDKNRLLFLQAHGIPDIPEANPRAMTMAGEFLIWWRAIRDRDTPLIFPLIEGGYNLEWEEAVEGEVWDFEVESPNTSNRLILTGFQARSNADVDIEVVFPPSDTREVLQSLKLRCAKARKEVS